MADKIVIFGVLKSITDYKVRQANKAIAQARDADSIIYNCREGIVNMERFMENNRQDFADKKETLQEIDEYRTRISEAQEAKRKSAVARQDLLHAPGFYEIYNGVLKQDLLQRRYACESDIATLDNRIDSVSINANTPEFGQDVNSIYLSELDYLKEKLKAKEKQLADINAKLSAMKTNRTR